MEEIIISAETDPAILTDREVISDAHGHILILGTPDRFSMTLSDGITREGFWTAARQLDNERGMTGLMWIGALPDGDRIRLI